MTVPTRIAQVAVGLAAVFVTACGCDAIGHPTMEVHLVDASSSRPLTLAGAVVSTRVNGVEKPPFTYQPADSGSTVWTCCSPGRWDLRVDRPGYTPFDTTVQVKGQGRCDIPVLKRFQVRLFPLPST